MQVASIAQELRVAVAQVRTQQTIVIREVKSMSENARQVLAYIAQSQKLSPDQKRTLARLVAIVDEFAGGNAKLMRDIVGIAKIMEMTAAAVYAPTSMRRMMEIYWEEREKLRDDNEVRISIETEVTAVWMEWYGVLMREEVPPPDEESCESSSSV